MKKLLHNVILILCCVSLNAHAVPDNFADLVENLMPTVVNIATTQKAKANTNDIQAFNSILPNQDLSELLERFGLVPPGAIIEGGERDRKAISLGSGFIIDKEGYIATNNHVIAEAEEIVVHLSDNKEYKAKLIGFDANTDLALLKIDSGRELPFVKFGDSENARVGEWVIAIGNQLGFGGTVTAGFISSKSRDINAGGIVDNFIQTDAAINSGSSGGPMFNIKGEVIGVNTAIVTPSMGNVGIGFATPSSLAKRVLDQLRNTGKVQRAYLGVKIQPVDEEIAESLGLDANKGVLIADVSIGSPADKAGLKAGDIILVFDGKEISNKNKLPRIVAETDIKKKVEIEFLRKNERKTTQVIIAELVDKDKEETLASDKNHKVITKDFYGLTISQITKELREKFDITTESQGCVIVKVSPKGGLWTQRGLKIGDVILGANQEHITMPVDLDNIIKKAIKRKRKSVLLLINRDSQLTFLTMPITNK